MHWEWPQLHLTYLKRIQHAHRHGIGTLICEVAAYPAAKALSRLADIDRFAIIIIESIDTEFGSSDRNSSLVDSSLTRILNNLRKPPRSSLVSNGGA